MRPIVPSGQIEEGDHQLMPLGALLFFDHLDGAGADLLRAGVFIQFRFRSFDGPLGGSLSLGSVGPVSKAASSMLRSDFAGPSAA
jgi:hypothetical protein